MKNAGKACNNRLYRHIRTFEKIVKNYFVIYNKNNKIYRKGEEIKPDTSGTNGKVVSGMSAHGLWFSASTSTEKITIYKKDIIDLAPNAHEVFMSYII